MNRRQALSVTAMAAGAAACTPLQLFDTLAPRDDRPARVRRTVRFGPGARQAFDITTPKGAKDAPVVVFFYGGGWDSGRRQDYEFAAAAFAAQGFVCAVPDYRLVPEVRFPTFVEDCAAAVAAVQTRAAEFGGDPARIVLAGHSAGAYNALMLALDARFLSNAGATIRGAAGLAGPYDFLPFDVRASIEAFGQFPDPSQTQPITFARADAPPTLLLTGLDDTTVRPRNTEALAKKLAELGAPVEAKKYPGITHAEILIALAPPLRTRAPVLADVSAFVRRVTASG